MNSLMMLSLVTSLMLLPLVLVNEIASAATTREITDAALASHEFAKLKTHFSAAEDSFFSR